MSPNSNLTIIGYRDPGLLFYGIALVCILTAGFFIFVQKPLQAWFIPEVKGRGGQLYTVIENFSSTAEIPQSLVPPLDKESS